MLEISNRHLCKTEVCLNLGSSILKYQTVKLNSLATDPFNSGIMSKAGPEGCDAWPPWPGVTP